MSHRCLVCNEVIEFRGQPGVAFIVGYSGAQERVRPSTFVMHEACSHKVAHPGFRFCFGLAYTARGTALARVRARDSRASIIRVGVKLDAGEAANAERCEYGLAPLRVRGLQRVALHADLCMLARLSLALSRARAVPLAA